MAGSRTLLLASALCWFATTACGPGNTAPSKAAPAAPAPRPGKVGTATTTPLPDVVGCFGSLAAEESVQLGFRHAGRLASLPVDVGSTITKGDRIAALDTTTFELELREAEAAVRQVRVRLGLPAEGADDTVDAEAVPSVRQARAVLREATVNRTRAEEQVQRGLASSASLDAALATHGVAESRLQQALNDVREHEGALAQRRVEVALARERLRDSALEAPFDGVVASRQAAVPEYLVAGARVLHLLRIDPLRLRLHVPERDAAAVRAGQAVRFTVDGSDGEHQGRIVRLSPEIRRDDRTLLVEATVANTDRALRPGQFCRASIEVSQPRPRVTVKAAAVVAFAGVEKVFVVADGKAVARTVNTGRRIADDVEITSGLEAGLPVVLDPGDLADGQPVLAANGG
jgi:RND family efflux transporter MFP subunit